MRDCDFIPKKESLEPALEETVFICSKKKKTPQHMGNC